LELEVNKQSKTAEFLAKQNNTINMPLYKQFLSLAWLSEQAGQWNYAIGREDIANDLLIRSAMLRRSAMELLEGAGDAH
jgi:hypothetical protein